ncbi:2-aminoadipate transaminase [Candidatus Hakubella thermalkaliphila]|uniref:2-aminoadipate transaminase n=2 Tax=Candidatus Hakubella thermalkaliphila TaxID=2754717 RepID=A0A6V8P5L4_9ACTN|nr:2-aminoadipate transaminase [Candidatus Hakubella thermalkaliphila]
MSSEIILDKWTHLYSERTKNMRSSEVRDLLDVTARSDIIPLAAGAPYVKALNFRDIEKYARKIIAEDGLSAFQYGPSGGFYPLKMCLVDVLKLDGIVASPDDILITDGGQQALDLLAKIFIDPGDIIIAEAPCYVGALNAFLSYQARVETVPVDENGLQIEVLEDKLSQLSREKEIKFIYTVPNFSNPSGVTLSFDRRKELVSLARRYGTLIIEDNPYGRLRFEGEHLKNLRQLDEENIIYVGTASKMFAPGLRIGWIVAPFSIRERLIHGKQAADLCSSNFTQRLAFEYFSDPRWKNTLKKFISIYKEHRDAMLGALEEHFPEEVTWSHPVGGFFTWATLPEYINTTEMLAEAITNKVAYVPGRGFYPDGSGTNCMRLAFCTVESEQIEEGIKRLGKIIKEQMRLYRSFYRGKK